MTDFSLSLLVMLHGKLVVALVPIYLSYDAARTLTLAVLLQLLPTRKPGPMMPYVLTLLEFHPHVLALSEMMFSVPAIRCVHKRK
uniref:Putative secreted protein n=1 Tax=Rhipicephalus microplus TaxID=6941 RepID=A0A6M2DA21_RHIMP